MLGFIQSDPAGAYVAMVFGATIIALLTLR